MSADARFPIRSSPSSKKPKGSDRVPAPVFDSPSYADVPELEDTVSRRSAFERKTVSNSPKRTAVACDSSGVPANAVDACSNKNADMIEMTRARQMTLIIHLPRELRPASRLPLREPAHRLTTNGAEGAQAGIGTALNVKRAIRADRWSIALVLEFPVHPSIRSKGGDFRRSPRRSIRLHRSPVAQTTEPLLRNFHLSLPSLGFTA